MKAITLFLGALCLPFMATASEANTQDTTQKTEKESKGFKLSAPKIHGTLRAKYEYQDDTKEGRFEVRNARVSVVGDLLPTVSYKAEIDLSDEGSIKMLDAYARVKPWKGFSFTAGQMRVPFTIDAHRSPHQQYFANRSFIAKQVGNVRDVGVTAGYTLPTDMKIILEAGMYNGRTILTDQKSSWHKQPSYSAKTQFFFTPGLNLTLGVQSVKPTTVRQHSYDIGAYYQCRNFHIEAEYLYKTYSQDAYKNVQAVNAFANYDIPLKKVFKKMSILARYDMMTDQWDGKTFSGEEKNVIKTTDYKRQRLTGGLTFSLGLPFTADIRLNYEKYFYAKHSIPKESEQDKFVAELMVRF